MDDLMQQASGLIEYTRALRRDLHQHPELGFQEFRTAGVVARELGELGIEVRTGIAQTGVVALIEGDRREITGDPDSSAQPDPVVLLRFDMDALPITEATGEAYTSQNPGVMHACGHDGHTAIGLTVARLLYDDRENWGGVVKLVFQPAEEGLGGAERMVAEGVLENPTPHVALALHLWNDKPLGWIGVTDGAVMAAAEHFKVKVIGVGGHGAVPHQAVDPVLASAHIISALQSIVSRNSAPLQSAVVSVTNVHGGGGFNVIPSDVELQGTIRTFEPSVREMVLARFEQITNDTAKAFGCRVEIELRSITPAVINDPVVTEQVRGTVKRQLPEFELDCRDRTMGSEDMAFMMDDVPGCYFFIGSANAELGLDAPHHHPRFDFDEGALWIASGLMACAARQFLS